VVEDEMEYIALITGANRGIGHEICRQLAEQDCYVLLSGRDRDATNNAANGLIAQGLHVEAIQLDVVNPDHLDHVVSYIETQFKRLDILVNNAAVYLDEGKSIFDVSIDSFLHTLETNLLGPLRLTQRLIPLIKRSKAGRIVNVSSGMGALHDMGGREAAYRVSKAGLNALTRIMASELQHTQIKVNAVCPGWVRTDMGGNSAPRDVEAGAHGIVWAATLPDDGPTGSFFRDGELLKW
jgi:NAD(P)-dependent dehydrogenase (short-subunit alcohol dehydrogenase family)